MFVSQPQGRTWVLYVAMAFAILGIGRTASAQWVTTGATGIPDESSLSSIVFNDSSGSVSLKSGATSGTLRFPINALNEGLQKQRECQFNDPPGTPCYDGTVTIRQLLTMTSGVRWNEDYTDVTSDLARMYAQTPPPGVDMTVSYVRTLPREAPPGTKWVYKTSETNLAGVLVAEATGKRLADYLSEKIWRSYGMERDAEWMIDDIGHEQGGCCLAMTLRDAGRFGQFVLDGARVAGSPIVPIGWLAEATRTQVRIGADSGYGFQWWTRDDGTFEGRGIYGQTLHIDPARRLVVVLNSAAVAPTDTAAGQARQQFIAAVAAQIDSEGW